MKKLKRILVTLSVCLTALTCGFAVASCGEKANENAHVHKYTWQTTKSATCTQKGVEKYLCSCGDENMSKEIPMLEHDYDDVEYNSTKHWKECSCGAKKEEKTHEYKTLEKDKFKHWYECECGAKKDEAEHDGVAASCKVKAVCKLCGEEYGEFGEHKYVNKVCIYCDEKEPSVGLEFTLSKDGTYYSVTGIGDCTDTDIVIPSIYNSLPVTEIQTFAFDFYQEITSVTIPESIEFIGEGGLYGCYNLTNIDVAKSNPNYISIDGNLYTKDATTLVQYAKGKTETVFSIPDTVITIGWSALDCDNLKTIIIPNSVTNIDGWTFNCCVTEMRVADDNPKYKSIDGNIYSKDGTILINYAQGKTDTFFVIPNTVTTVGEAAFINASYLKSVEIPNSVTVISDYAFSCWGITNITIPDSVTSIGFSAFGGGTLAEINVAETNPNYKSIDGNLYNKDGTMLIQYAQGKTETSFVIPDSVTTIGNNAFGDKGCKLANITIPDSVTTIGGWAFAYCEFTSIEIPNSVTSIGGYAFAYCDNLTTIKFNGTTEEWNAIEKGIDWNYDVPATEVICNGNVELQ